MKHTKIFFTLLVLAAALLAFGCTSAGANFSPTASMWMEFNGLVSDLQTAAANRDVTPETIKNKVAERNGKSSLKEKAKLLDLQEGTTIKKIDNTDKAKEALAEQLKKRFVLVPIV